MPNRIQLRRDTAATWTTKNPVLASGEPGVETDTGFFKVGNGTSTWTALPYTVGSAAGATLLDHLADVSGSIPATGEVALMWNRTTSQWEPTQLRSRPTWRQRVQVADWNSNGQNLNTAVPTRGEKIFILTEALCTGLFARMNIGQGATVKLTLARLTGSSPTTTSDWTLAEILNEQTVTATGTTGIQEVSSSFPAITLTPGTPYIMLVTDPAGGTPVVLNGSGGQSGGGMFTQAVGTSAKHTAYYATSDPAVGDVMHSYGQNETYTLQVGAILELPLSP